MGVSYQGGSWISMPLSVYIHIPFCEVKCGYCDFFSIPRGYEDFDLQREYVQALINEIREIREIRDRSARYSGNSLHSLFFGGGTPSLLQPDLLECILQELARHFSWGRETEITLESNPKTVSLEKLRAFRGLGINRISIGVQSFQDRFLKTLGRIHDGNDARRTIHDARAAGFENVSCDLIFALPGQSFEDWRTDLETAIGLETDHISAYHLTIEAGTAFDGLRRKGALHLPEEEEGVRCLTWTRERLTQAGFLPYEVSNFARPGRKSVHNQNYWEYGEYLGFGTSASSFLKHGTGRVRRSNVRDLKKYLEGQWEGFSENLTEATARGEFCMLGLRISDGISERRFLSEFGKGLDEVYGETLRRWANKGWLKQAADSWRATEGGLLFLDEMAASFLP